MAQLSGSDLKVRITTQSDGDGVDQTEKKLNRLQQMTQKATAASQKFAKGLLIAGTIAATATAGGVVAASKAAWDQVYAVEQATVALNAYEKDAGKVNKVLNELVAYARSDMGVLFQRQDLFAAAQGLKIMGAETDNLTKYVEIMSRSVGLGLSTFDDLGRVIGRVGSTGKLTGIDFDMLTKAGFKLDDSLRNANITWEQLFKHLDKGIPAGAMAGQAETIRGKTIRLQSAFRALGLEILGVDKETSKFIEGGLGDMMMRGFDTLIQLLKDAAPAVKTLSSVVTAAVAGVVAFVDSHGDSIASFFKMIGENIPIVAGAVVGALIPAMVALATTLLTVTIPAIVAGALALAPFIAAGAALGLLANVIMDNWEPIKGFFTDLWDSATSGITTAMDWIGEKAEWFKNNWAEAIGFVIGYFFTLPIRLPGLMRKAVSSVVDSIRSVDWKISFSDIVDGFFYAMQMIRTAGRLALTYLKSLPWGDFFLGIGKGIGNAILGLIEGALKGALSDIPVFGELSKKLNLPRFDNGGTVPGPIGSPQIVLAHGGETILPTHKQPNMRSKAGVVIENFNMTVQENADWTFGLARLDNTIAARLG